MLVDLNMPWLSNVSGMADLTGLFNLRGLVHLLQRLHDVLWTDDLPEPADM